MSEPGRLSGLSDEAIGQAAWDRLLAGCDPELGLDLVHPVPPYAVLEARGFGHRSEDLGGGDHRVAFTRSQGPVGD
ncbi:MAG: hypothetical protein ACYDD0_11330 [Candidatus Dormibacteria bacterium]